MKKAVVTVNSKPLPLRFDLGKISPSGFGATAARGRDGSPSPSSRTPPATKLPWRNGHGFIKKLDMRQPFTFTASDVTAFLSGLPVDAQQFIRPVRTKEKTGWRNFWKRLLEKAA